MSKELDLLKKLHRKSFEKVLQVYEVFQDYFDEDRVDLQGIQDLDTFIDYMSNHTYSWFLTRTGILDSDLYRNLDEPQKLIVRTLLTEGALGTKICSDETVFKYLFPFLYEKYIPRTGNTIHILVHFPEVRVTNEYDKYVDIKDLYARIKVSPSGRIVGTFELNRTDYPVSHALAGYLHSHVSGTSISRPKEFHSPCLGRGPINNTIASLVTECDLGLWMLFCRELDTYVGVESLNGGPYVKMETITGKARLNRQSTSFSTALYCGNPYRTVASIMHLNEFYDFIKYIISNKIIKFNYSNGGFNLAMSYLDYRIALSNAFIHFVNNKIDRSGDFELRYSVERLESYNIMHKYVIKDSQLYNISNRSYSVNDYLACNGREAFTFKGKQLYLNIYDDTLGDDTYNTVLLISAAIAESLLFHILTYLNIIHGKNTAQTGSHKEFIVI